MNSNLDGRLPGMAEGGAESGPITCLGLTFPSHQARREHFTARLREFLNDPEYRARHDLPRASLDDILRLSDPPFYTACPNPFLPEFVQTWAADNNHEPPQPNPLAIDVSEGKGDPLYKAHSYHTKVPFKAILPAILHYTRPGDIVLDGFCGSGMVGVAAQLCGTTDPHLRAWAEALLTSAGYDAPQWGARHAILNDLSPAATFIASGYNLPFDVPAFEREAQRLLRDFDAELGWMYETKHTDGSPGRINYTVWSQVFACPHCHGDITFTHAAMNPETGKIVEPFPCPHCHATVAKRGSQKEGIAALTPLYETVPDPANPSQTMQRLRRKPVLINYDAKGHRYEKQPDANDLAILDRISQMPLPESVPTNALPLEQMYHGTRLGPKGITHLHHFYLPRQAQALGWLWGRANAQADTALRRMLLWFVEQSFWTMSIANSYRPAGFSQVSQYLKGVYYIPAHQAEVSPWYVLDGKRKQLGKAFSASHAIDGGAAVSTGTAASIDLSADCIDYIFTDPPYGENIYYADLNYLVESWHRVITAADPEAIVDQAKQKELPDYERLMTECLAEYNRVLKPGHWMTLVFSNSLNAVWTAIQDALAAAGFLVADVRALNKEAMSFRQATSDAIKKDLIVSAYKPSAGFAARVQARTGTQESAWVFVEEHLGQVPIFSALEEEGEARGEVLTERQPHVLYDRMVAWHVLHTYPVPISLSDFLRELRQRYTELDGMMFRADQVAEYERSRVRVPRMQTLVMVISDEQSALQWLRQELGHKPQTYPEVHTEFTAKTSWLKSEELLELKELLAENFLSYDGTGPIPAPLWGWLRKSSPWRDRLGDQTPETAGLEAREACRGRWYVPDPDRAADLEKLREKALLKEYDDYLTAPKKELATVRREALRAGFRRDWQAHAYPQIAGLAGKLPRGIVENDTQLLRWVSNARRHLED